MTTQPSPLKPGATIGICAPSSPFKRDLFDRGIAVLHAMGFRTRVPEEIFESGGYLAGADARRADGVNRLFADPAVDGIVCARGGYGSMRMLGHLDFDGIRAHPKVFVGFSDISALLYTLYRRCGMTVFHGPTVTTLDADPASRQAFIDCLTGTRTDAIAPETGATLKAGVATGPLVGGNLTTLCHLIGTAYAPDFRDHILFLEDRGEAPYRIDRMLTQMRLAGCMDGLAGLVLGSFTECGDPGEIHRIVVDVLGDLDGPILSGVDVGHGPVNLTVPIGRRATLDADKQRLDIHPQ